MSVAWIVTTEELAEKVNTSGGKVTHISMYSWSYSKVGTARDGVVNKWLVIVEY